MGSIQTGVGLVSGIDIANVVDQLMQLQRAPIRRLEQRAGKLQSVDGGIKSLEANLLSLTTSIQRFGQTSLFKSFNVQNSDPSQLTVTAGSEATAGTFRFRALREASTFQALSRGYANADQQTLGPGQLTIADGGGLNRATLLDALGGGAGVGRGTIRITDRSGSSADVDLSAVHTVDDVLAAINGTSGISVTAAARGDRLVLTDTSGGSASDLIVEDLGSGSAAADLGIAGSVATNSLNGAAIFSVTEDFTLELINDGNGLNLLEGAPDLRITLSDDATLEVKLDGVATIKGVLDAINNHADNGGKVSAALVNGRLELTDLSGGGGAGVFSAEEINGSSVLRQLGLDTAASGGVISGRRLAAGINSVLIRNLRGGQGIDQPGSVTLTDRTGTTATIDLSAAESLDEVLGAINTAQATDGTDLQLEARVNKLGTGIEVVDTSGATASNLIISDVGGGTTAAQLGIAVDAATDAVDSGNLGLRYVNQATSLEGYAPDGGTPAPGSIKIIDSAGNEALVSISSAVTTIGDVLQRINAAGGVSVRAELNETGDGFVLIDEAGGAGALRVEEAGGTTASDLKILGDGTPGSDGKSRIASRKAAVIDITADDTLDDVVQKINDAAGFVQASVFNDGSAFNSFRLALSATKSGRDGRLILDDGGLGFGFNTVVEGEDALLRVGGTPESGFLIASATNNFPDVLTGIEATVTAPGTQNAEVTVSQDLSKVEEAIREFVKNYNTFLSNAAELTKYDPETQRRGILQGDNIVVRIRSRLDSLIHGTGDGSGPVRSLVDLGVRFGASGKLIFDETRLQKQLDQNPEAVADFFQIEETGFADRAEQVMESLTDPLTGTLTREQNSLQESVDALFERIALMDQLLARKRERLLREFIRMEEVLGQLTSQQEQIGRIKPLSVTPARTGIF